jgi:hypothetical protein
VSDLNATVVKNIELIIDLDALATLVRKHCPGKLDEPKWREEENVPIAQRLAEQFMFVYSKWQEDRHPPDHTDSGSD